VAPQGPGD